MEHPFFTTAATRAEALRWLTIAEKLLSARDLLGSKSFATRARDSDPTLVPANEILAVVDTLLSGDRRIGNNLPDFYAILRLTPQQGGDSELVADHYRSLVLLLNPQKNKFPFAEQAFRLVIDAWSVLSNPSRKSLYDKELAFYLQPQQYQPDPFNVPMPALQQNFVFFGGGAVHGGQSSSTGATHYAQLQQVHAQPQVEPMVGDPTREPPNFTSFHSGPSFVFGSGSVSRSSHEPVNNQGQENYSTFAGFVPSASGATQEQLNNKEKQSQQDYSNVSDNHKPIPNVNVNENVGETIEDVNENVGETIEDVDGIEEEEVEEEAEEEKIDSPVNDDESTFWTACPYCYYMYEYPRVYVDCTLRCQNCTRAFQAVVIPSPPPTVDGQEAYFCCWGFMPLGFSIENWEKNRNAASSWSPFSPMFTCPRTGSSANKRVIGRKSSGPRVYIDDDEDFLDISSSSESDVDWQDDRDRKRSNKVKNVKGKETTRTPNRNAKKAVVNQSMNVDVQDAVVSPLGVETPNKIVGPANARKQPGRVVKNFGKLDLNVELSNEAEEPAQSTNHRVDDNIEGIGFFEGLDEYFSSLPILNVVGDDKVVKAA
ncbi:hypothetical protein DH2020_030007 [Rehmannia glutinosa]|uniref:J domain-containing protein n=1 Tax=Rehmannia glutinosa TaxID=99300 RepID=A0ABR0VQ61_REHGL